MNESLFDYYCRVRDRIQRYGSFEGMGVGTSPIGPQRDSATVWVILRSSRSSFERDKTELCRDFDVAVDSTKDASWNLVQEL